MLSAFVKMFSYSRPETHVIACCLFMSFFFGSPAAAEVDPWIKKQSNHFEIWYTFNEDAALARKILRDAERAYQTTAAHIGYTRYDGYWTWDERVRIILFPDQISFTQITRQPPWTRGYASRHSELFKSKVIVTYRQEEMFLEEILPHEVSHLVLHDYIGFDKNIPWWFDEGVAQLSEESKVRRLQSRMKVLAQKDQVIPFRTFSNLRMQSLSTSAQVSIFYAQSLSVVKFLLTQYGADAFQRLNRELKDGKGFEEGLRRAYRGQIQTVAELEERWLKFLKNL